MVAKKLRNDTMIINKILNHIFTSPSIIAVLRELDVRNTGITGREIARAVNISHRTELKALDNLEALKLVTRRVAGKSYYFTLNRNQFLNKKITSVIFKSEQEYKRSIFDKIKTVKNSNVASLILFGSVARKDETYGSDLDLCIVYNKTKTGIEEKINILRDKLYDEFGVSLAPFYITESNFKQKAKNLKAPVNNLINEGIVICGKSINRIIYGKKNIQTKH